MKIILDGVPVSQARMRLSKWGVFDPCAKDKARTKAEIDSYVKQFYMGKKKINNPRICFVFQMPILKSSPGWLKSIQMTGKVKHTKKPDIDNLIKFYLDCMDGILFDGDQAVTLGPCVKVYHPHPKTFITLNESTDSLHPLEVDPMTWFCLYGQESDKQSYDEMVCLDDSYTPDQLTGAIYNGVIYPHQIIDTLKTKPFVHPYQAEDIQASSSIPSYPLF